MPTISKPSACESKPTETQSSLDTMCPRKFYERKALPFPRNIEKKKVVHCWYAHNIITIIILNFKKMFNVSQGFNKRTCFCPIGSLRV